MDRGYQLNRLNTRKRDIMVGATIVLLLTCGGILVQGSPYLMRGSPNGKSNPYSLVGRSGRPLSRYRPDNEVDDPRVVLENVRRKLYDENDLKTASVATAAADAALAITKSLVDELSASIAVTVAETVAQILRRHSDRTIVARRSYNTNTNMNTNMNIIGQDYDGASEPQRGQGSNGFGQGSDSLRGPGGSPLGWSPQLRRVPYGRGTGGLYHDEELEVEQVEEKAEVAEEEVATTTEIPPIEVEAEVKVEAEEEEKESPASKSLPAREWGPINLPGYGGNSNSNSNSNSNNNQMDFRRNSNGVNIRPRSDINNNRMNDEKKFLINRKNYDSNSNNMNNSRRKNYPSSMGNRRNINSNANNNRIDRGYGYRRY